MPHLHRPQVNCTHHNTRLQEEVEEDIVEFLATLK